MKLILKKDFENLGHKNEMVKVADGYARNFLIPKGIAIEITSSNLKAIEEEVERSRRHKERKLHAAQRLAQKIEGTSLTITKTSGEEDRLFGSVTKEDIINGLKENGIDIDKKMVNLEEPIKKLGIYSVNIKLHPEVEAKAKVWVIRDR